MINGGGFTISNKALSEIVNLHKFHPVFFRRKVTTWSIEGLSYILNIEIGLSFVIVNFLFLSGVLVYFLSKQITQSSKFSLISIVAYFLCFSNLFAFYPPVYTYDEPLQFCFVLSSLLLFFKNKYWWFIFLFSISLIIRESGVILLPELFFIFIYDLDKSVKENIKSLNFVKKTLGLLIPIAIYLFYIYIVLDTIDEKKSSNDYLLLQLSRIGYNFQSIQFTIETLISTMIIFILPIYLLISNNKFKFREGVNRKLINTFLLTFIINTILIYLTARARELRLLVLPLFFLWPIFGSLFFDEIRLIFKSDKYKKLFLNVKNRVVFLLITFINLYVSFVIYQPTAGPKIGVFNLYLFLSFTFILMHYMLSNQKKI